MRPNSTITITHKIQTLLTTETRTRNPNPYHIAQIHAHLITTRTLFIPYLHTQLINLYALCNLTRHALLTFSSTLPTSNTVTFTSLISHLSRSRLPSHALSLFSLLLQRRPSLSPNPFTFSAVLPACAATGLPDPGRQVHALARKLGVEPDVFVATALLDMYAKCDDVGSARKVFDEMPQRSLVSWNAVIVGFVRSRVYGEAMGMFRDLVGDGDGPDEVSFSSVLSACANSGRLGFGVQVHGVVVKVGAECLVYVRNALVDMYSKCWCVDDARVLFEGMRERDVVSWNIRMMGFVQSEEYEEACKCFLEMRKSGISPDVASFSTVIRAICSIASWGHGTAFHAQIIGSGFASENKVGSPLITMYLKCGCLEDAHRVFEEMRENLNVVSWTAMIAAFQQHGHGDQATQLFDEMLELGIEPDYITFVCVLSACSYNGLIDEGFRYFNLMSGTHNVEPGSEHYACIVDMLGRAGRLGEAKKFIEEMPIQPDASVWGALLGACRNCGDLELGKEVAQRLFEIEPENSGNYVLLSNMYAYHGKLKEAGEVRRLMEQNRVRKETGCSWIDVKDKTFVFTVNDLSHSKTREIYDMLKRIWLKRRGTLLILDSM